MYCRTTSAWYTVLIEECALAGLRLCFALLLPLKLVDEIEVAA